MTLCTFTVDGCVENSAHWEKIKKSLKDKDHLDGVPITMLYAANGRVIALAGFEDYKELKQKMIDFIQS